MMKKLFFFHAMLSLLLVACSQSDQPIASSGKGVLQISSVVNNEIDLVTVRNAPDVNNFKLLLQDENNPGNSITGLLSEFPNGRVEDITAGTYSITLCSDPDGFSPAFEKPVYTGIRQNVAVKAGETTNVAIECTQSNTGVYFKYDASLEELGLTDIVPIVSQGSAALTFEGANKTSKGYFIAKDAVLKIKHQDAYLSISGSESQTLQLAPEQLWEIVLRAKQAPGAGGSLQITATVKVITDATNFEEFILDKNDEGGNEGEEGEGFMNVSINSLTAAHASLLMKGTGIESVKYNHYSKEELNIKLAEPGATLQSIVEIRGYDLSPTNINTINAEGFVFNIGLLSPNTEYVFVAVVGKEGAKKAQRFDFTTK